MRLTTAVGAVALTSVLAGLGFVGPAVPVHSDAVVLTSAAAATRGDACGPGACGSATFTFEGNKKVISNASLSVKDTSLDGHDVFIHIRVHDASGVRDVLRVDNAGGRGETNVENGRRYESRTIINGVQIMVCVDDFGSNTCYFSRFIDNPQS
jgi:hypothetical protein